MVMVSPCDTDPGASGLATLPDRPFKGEACVRHEDIELHRVASDPLSFRAVTTMVSWRTCPGSAKPWLTENVPSVVGRRPGVRNGQP
jgi:hypothetical protein